MKAGELHLSLLRAISGHRSSVMQRLYVKPPSWSIFGVPETSSEDGSVSQGCRPELLAVS